VLSLIDVIEGPPQHLAAVVASGHLSFACQPVKWPFGELDAEFDVEGAAILRAIESLPILDTSSTKAVSSHWSKDAGAFSALKPKSAATGGLYTPSRLESSSTKAPMPLAASASRNCSVRAEQRSDMSAEHFFWVHPYGDQPLVRMVLASAEVRAATHCRWPGREPARSGRRSAGLLAGNNFALGAVATAHGIGTPLSGLIVDISGYDVASRRRYCASRVDGSGDDRDSRGSEGQGSVGSSSGLYSLS
jgi:hypothetical protein